MKTVLVTGVAGFIGSAIARRLYADGFKVYGVDDLSSGDPSKIPIGIDFIEADLSCSTRLPNTDLILHLAGQSSGEISFDNPVADLNKNTVSCLNLIEHAVAGSCKRFLYASSMSVYGAVPDEPISEREIGSPLSCYGVGKLAAEHYLKIFSNHLSSSSLRMFNVYGPGQNLDNLRQGMVSIYLAQALKSRKIVVKGDLERFRDFIYIDDVVDAWTAIALHNGPLAPAINIGTGVRTSVSRLVDEIRSLLPDILVEVADGTPGDQSGIYADTQLLRQYLCVNEFLPVASGLKKFLNEIERSAN